MYTLRRWGPGRTGWLDLFNLKLSNLGRICLIIACLVFSVFRLSAQYSTNLEFVENKGQWDTSLIKFKASMSTGALFMQQHGFTVLLNDTNDIVRIGKIMHGDRQLKSSAVSGSSVRSSSSPTVTVTATSSGAAGKADGHGGSGGGSGGGSSGGATKGGGGSGDTSTNPLLMHSHSYRVTFENANSNVVLTPDKPLGSFNNYFIGDQKNWATHCQLYLGLLYQNMYDGIDVHYYTDMGFVKYDIVVHPGADENKIVMKYEGQDKLFIKKNKLYVQTTVGTVQELEPHSYELSGAGRTPVECSYVLLSGNRVQFKVKNHTPGTTLVIDPPVVYCSFTGSRSDNWGYTATYDNGGNFYAGGIVLNEDILPGNGYLVSPGAYQTSYQGGDGSEGWDYDIGIMKFGSSLSTRLYATYLGGSGDEQPHSMVVDAGGNLIVTGRTSSTNYPVLNGATFGPTGGFDIFITKFNSDGTGLLGSLKIGGTGSDGVNYYPKYAAPPAGQGDTYNKGAHDLRLNYGDDGRGEVILDASNNIYVATCTQSSDFYTVNAFQASSGGGQDGVFIKTNPNASAVLSSGYIGGAGADAAFVLDINPTDNTVWLAGGTMSNNFPGTNSTVYQPSWGGLQDGFVSQISNDGKTLLKSSYFGTASTDLIYGLEFDAKGYPYITGTTNGLIPIVNSPWNSTATDGINQAKGKQFITKLKPDLTGIVYSANFGPGNTTFPNISPTAFLVDRCENVYVAGWGGYADLYANEGYYNSGTTGLTPTGDATQSTTDGADFYFFVLQKNASSQLYGSFFGQVNGVFGDHVDGGTSRFDKQGAIYEAICANCYGGANFPTSTSAWQRTNGTGSKGCNEAAVKIKFTFAGVSAGLKVITHGRGDSVGCVPLTVTIEDTIRNARSYIWTFGDGSPSQTTSSTTYQLEHTYTSVGTYRVSLVAIDSNSCNVADTAYWDVYVKNNPADLDFRYDKEGPCTSLNYLFTNLSSHASGAPDFTDTSFTWNFGDNSGTIVAGPDPVTHSYASPGPYNVVLSLIDTNYCNYPTDTLKLVYVAQNVKAAFTTAPLGCAPYTAIFTNMSIAGQQFSWNFGDGSPIDHSVNPTHLYVDTGTYTITLTAVDSTTCNIVDDTTFTIEVKSKPTADFTFAPTPPQPPNTPTVFTDASTPAIKYVWQFGDGTSETRSTPDTVVHQFIKTDTYTVCEIVTNEAGCSDTACHPVAVVVNPLLDVPNAFTPGRFGENSIIKVAGFGITHMDWRIYNRWGQLVFESNTPYIGWDGTYKGTLQPMDVYTYTLDAQFSDGNHVVKKGDITLIR